MHLRPHIAAALAIDEAARTVTAVITSAAPDRAGDVVVPAGLENAEEFLLNPVVLWAHQRAMPQVGTRLSLDAQPGRVVAVTKLQPEARRGRRWALRASIQTPTP